MKVLGLVLGSLLLSTSSFALDCYDYVMCGNRMPDHRYETQRQLETFRDELRHEQWLREQRLREEFANRDHDAWVRQRTLDAERLGERMRQPPKSLFCSANPSSC